MEIKKSTQVGQSGQPTAAQLESIRAYAKGELKAEDVYVFSLRLCDDQVDRDLERFDTQALAPLAKLFLGKTGILDHRWSSDGQVARIFQTQVVREERVSYIKAWAYIRRGSHTREVIADIEAGIKKEVSVGCAMGRSQCSICGADYGTCGHRKGEHYDGMLCCAILTEPMDAYEFSFVAVPAQPQAGVLKGLARGKRSLKELAEEFGAQGEYRQMFQEAQLGRQYRKELEDQVVRLCLMLELGAAEPVLRAVVEKAGAQELDQLRRALQERADRRYPPVTQLPGGAGEGDTLESGYLI